MGDMREEGWRMCVFWRCGWDMVMVVGGAVDRSLLGWLCDLRNRTV